jgi:hypothetical protein
MAVSAASHSVCEVVAVACAACTVSSGNIAAVTGSSDTVRAMGQQQITCAPPSQYPQRCRYPCFAVRAGLAVPPPAAVPSHRLRPLARAPASPPPFGLAGDCAEPHTELLRLGTQAAGEQAVRMQQFGWRSAGDDRWQRWRPLRLQPRTSDRAVQRMRRQTRRRHRRPCGSSRSRPAARQHHSSTTDRAR